METDTNEFGDASDVTNSTAFLSLDALLEEGKLQEDKVSFLKIKFKELHDHVLTVYAGDNYLLKRARLLRKELDDIRDCLIKCGESAKDDDNQIFTLKKELTAAEADLSAAQEKESMLQVEALELERKKHNLKNELIEKEEEEENNFRPVLAALEREIKTLGGNIDKMNLDFEDCKAQRESLIEKERMLKIEISAVDKIVQESAKDVARIDREPERAKKQADIVGRALATTQKELNSMLEKISNQMNVMKDQEELLRSLTNTRYEEQLKLEREKSLTESRVKLKARVIESLKSDRILYDQCTQRVQEIEIALKSTALVINKEREVLHRVVRDKDDAEKDKKVIQTMINEASTEKGMLQQQNTLLVREIHQINCQRKILAKELDELKKSVDLLIHKFLKEEVQEKLTSTCNEQLIPRIKEAEEKVTLRVHQEYINTRTLAQLSIERERASRESSRSQTKVLEITDEVKVKEVTAKELQKRNRELGLRLSYVIDQYATVKRERSDKATKIQEATQQMSETQEKIKILENELEVLRRESLEKEKTYVKLRRTIHNAEKQREKQRMEANARQLQFRERNKHTEDKGTEIEKLNDVITAIERTLLDLKKKYEDAVENRNFTGIQLIDRNDELCILYEKSNIQENILKNGEIMLKQREGQIRTCMIQLADLQRELDVCQKLLPQLYMYEEELTQLMENLEQEHIRIQYLEEDVVDPANRNRWRKLLRTKRGKQHPPVSTVGSKAPERGDTIVDLTSHESIDDVELRIRELETKLCLTNEKIMEKDLVYDDVSNLTSKLREQALSGRQYTLSLAMKVNEFQYNIKRRTRQMMATLSELSIIQASAMHTELEGTNLEEQLKMANERISKGLPPTETIDNELNEELEREKRSREICRNTQHKTFLDKFAPKKATIPRPNAYIPQGAELAIPKPYGALAPFKSVTTANPQRFCKIPKDIELKI